MNEYKLNPALIGIMSKYDHAYSHSLFVCDFARTPFTARRMPHHCIPAHFSKLELLLPNKAYLRTSSIYERHAVHDSCEA